MKWSLVVLQLFFLSRRRTTVIYYPDKEEYNYHNMEFLIQEFTSGQ